MEFVAEVVLKPPTPAARTGMRTPLESVTCGMLLVVDVTVDVTADVTADVTPASSNEQTRRRSERRVILCVGI